LRSKSWRPLGRYWSASAAGRDAPPPTARRPQSAPRPSVRRGGNTRANQALQLVGEKPGITIPQIAESLKIEPNYLYRVMPRLVEDGSVRRDGQGWHAVSSNGA
jgi:predicted HTH transcriptional regulator